jgi:hypothetical protein
LPANGVAGGVRVDEPGIRHPGSALYSRVAVCLVVVFMAILISSETADYDAPHTATLSLVTCNGVREVTISGSRNRSGAPFLFPIDPP